jgi:peptide deformylase
MKQLLISPDASLLNDIADEVLPGEVNSKRIQDTIEQMLTLSASKGHGKKDSRQMVGLAAPQISVSKRIITIDLAADGSNKKQHLLVMINPKITHLSKTTLHGREGCWSCGNICGNVERAKEVVLEGLNREGKPMKVELSGFVARIAQHEVDHLNGIRFPDRIPIHKPEYLHWVERSEFDDYRKNWMHWDKFCPRKTWEAMKAGDHQ